MLIVLDLSYLRFLGLKIMKKWYFVALVLLIEIGFSSCSPKVSQGSRSSADYVKEDFKPRGPLFWIAPSGIYKGAIPCSDCAGIEVTLNFKKDYTVEKTTRYIKAGGKTSKIKGTWVVQAGNIVQIDYPGKMPKEFYKAQAGAHLIGLNAKKEIEKNPTGQFNMFNKY